MFRKKIKCVCGKNISKKYEFCPHCGTSLKKIEFLRNSEKQQSKFKDKQIDEITKTLSHDFGMPFINSFPFKTLIKRFSKDMEKQLKEAFEENIVNSQEPNIFGQEMSMNIPKNAEKSKQDIVKNGKRVGNVEEFNFPGGHGIKINIKMNNGFDDVIKNDLNDNFRLKFRPEIKNPNQNKSKTNKINRKTSIQNQKFNEFSEKENKKYSSLRKQEAKSSVRRLSGGIIYEIDLPDVKNEKEIMITKLQDSIEIKAISKDIAYHKLLPISLPIKSHNFKDNKLILELSEN